MYADLRSRLPSPPTISVQLQSLSLRGSDGHRLAQAHAKLTPPTPFRPSPIHPRIPRAQTLAKAASVWEDGAAGVPQGADALLRRRAQHSHRYGSPPPPR